MVYEKKVDLTDKYKAKGAQKVDYKEYLAMQRKQAQQPKFRLPVYAKILLVTPFLIIFCFGVFYIPFLIFKAASSSSKSQTTGKSGTTISGSKASKSATEKTR
ncbi:MAG: hypothetical protein Q8Q08_06505 [Candidatus Omnitrophota bacterium]|nr:hypothetical protein [Candidatus Omnitrophota bacterium]MDZ4243262.1 hypothetical protein [Candidatus Omnitrophota bacterium]